MTVHSRLRQVLTFARHYAPETTFKVIDRLPQVVVARILGRERAGDPVVWDTADYEAYLVTDRLRDDTWAEYFPVFVDGSLQNDQRYAFGGDAVFFDRQLALVEVSYSRVEETPDA